MNKKHILVGHPYWGRGGAEIAAMWMLQVLLVDCRVDVVTRGGWDLDDLNRASGTNIQEEEIKVIYSPFSNLRFAGALWLGFFLRFCRKIAPRYDLCITASRVIDWGTLAIHFLSDVTWNRSLQKEFESAEALSRKGLIRGLYWWLADVVTGKSGRNPEQNDLFIANSQWTAKYAKKYCSREVKVIAPPVPGVFSNLVPWDNRESAFVCLGRISIEKNIEQVIAIMEQVREFDPSVSLHLVGRFGQDTYSHKILSLCESRKEWITVHDGLYGEKKETLLGRCRYGISACRREAFGIATAEMIKAGIIPFVPIKGAQRELLNNDDLCYNTIVDAEKKICSVLASETSQIELHNKMKHISETLSPEKFFLEVRSLVKSAIG